MKTKHTYVVLIDLPEALSFEVKPEKQSTGFLKRIERKTDHSETELFNFISVLENNFGEEFNFIGEDVIAEKFYKRFLFQKSGFLEVMCQAPVAIIAHFIDPDRARKFSEALKKTIEETVKDEKAKTILKNLVELNTEKEESLTYQKWSKLAVIRGMVER